VESKVAVGTTRHVLRPLRERGMFVGFSPERVDPGRMDPPTHAIPKFLAAMDEASMDRISDLYGAAFDRVVPVSSLETTEMSKLFKNWFRLINIAYVNEIADACAAHGIDPNEKVRACAIKPYGYMSFTPGLGAGEPCIPSTRTTCWSTMTCPCWRRPWRPTQPGPPPEPQLCCANSCGSSSVCAHLCLLF